MYEIRHKYKRQVQQKKPWWSGGGRGMTSNFACFAKSKHPILIFLVSWKLNLVKALLITEKWHIQSKVTTGVLWADECRRKIKISHHQNCTDVPNGKEARKEWIAGSHQEICLNFTSLKENKGKLENVGCYQSHNSVCVRIDCGKIEYGRLSSAFAWQVEFPIGSLKLWGSRELSPEITKIKENRTCKRARGDVLVMNIRLWPSSMARYFRFRNISILFPFLILNLRQLSHERLLCSHSS